MIIFIKILQNNFLRVYLKKVNKPKNHLSHIIKQVIAQVSIISIQNSHK